MHRVLLFRELRTLALEDACALSIDIDIFLPLGGHATFAVNCFNRASWNACSAVDAIIGVDYEHVPVLVEAFYGALGDAIGVLAITTRFSHHMRHGYSSVNQTEIHQEQNLGGPLLPYTISSEGRGTHQ